MNSALLVFGIFALLISILMIIVSFRAVFYAFIKKKDERSKWIVTKSMANSFVTIVILQTILFTIKWLYYDGYQAWWNSLKESIYIEPALLSFIILGTILIFNTKKYGGSL